VREVGKEMFGETAPEWYGRGVDAICGAHPTETLVG